jgi:ADP-ribose pyrophosphatase YjhB (NUDIX family)
MRTISILYLTAVVALLASCGTTATTIVTRLRLDKDAAGKLAYERIAVTSSVRQFTQRDLDQLRDAVLARHGRHG